MRPRLRPTPDRIRPHFRQIREGRHRVPGDEVVYVWQRRGHTLLHRLIPDEATMRVHPDHPMREAMKSCHLVSKKCRAPPLPTVTGEHHDGPTRHPALTPAVQEGLERFSEPG